MERKNTEPAVETKALTKIYKGKAAVNNLDMKVQKGAIYGFIGRNGAGKSTTLKCISGLAAPTRGEIKLFGKPAQNPYAARRLGCLIESAGLYPNLTARDNVVAKAKCMGLTDKMSVDRVLSVVGLSDAGNKKTKHFSMGMKQRLGIALALLGNPDLLILDEPINGLDPEGIREVRKLLLALNEEGKTLIISSHILGELGKISTHYGIIKDGKLVEQIDSKELLGKCKDYFQIEVDDVRRAMALIAEHAPTVQTEVCDGRHLRLYDLKDGAWLNQLLIENHVSVSSSGYHHLDLEEYFLSRMDGMEAAVEGGRKNA